MSGRNDELPLKGHDCREVVFFFQAEDGIRDWSVTGVQTCALPISRVRPVGAPRSVAAKATAAKRRADRADAHDYVFLRDKGIVVQRSTDRRARKRRSEERRVGKEWRSRWSP